MIFKGYWLEGQEPHQMVGDKSEIIAEFSIFMDTPDEYVSLLHFLNTAVAGQKWIAKGRFTIVATDGGKLHESK